MMRLFRKPRISLRFTAATTRGMLYQDDTTYDSSVYDSYLYDNGNVVIVMDVTVEAPQ